MAKNIETEVREDVSTSQRVSIGLIAISLSLISLSLGIALFSSSGAVLFVTPNVQQSSTPSTATAVTLNWTAPGDDGAVGTASSYDIRISTSPITGANFSTATQLTGEPLPQTAGSTETFTAVNLTPATTYYFALKTSDEAGNVSDLSNVATKTTSAVSEACQPTYTCTEWSACSNGAQTRTCTVNNGCAPGLNQPIGTQACTADAGAVRVTVKRHLIAAGTGPGIKPTVRLVTPATGKVVKEFAPFGSTEKNGTQVTVGEFTGDQLADIAVGTSAGTDAKVRLFNEQGKRITEFNPYPTQRKTGVSLAAGDIDGDGREELITVPMKGTSQVRVFTFNTTTKKFVSYTQGFAYAKTLLSGFSVASADLNLDGRAEIIVAPRTKGRSVTVWQVTTEKKFKKLSSFNAYPITPTSGLTLATGDINADGRSDILTAMGPGYWTDVKAFDQRGRLIAHVEPASRSYLGGMSLASLDVNSDGIDEILVGNYQGSEPRLRVFRYDSAIKKFKRIQSYLAYPSRMQSGLRIGGI